MRPIRVAILGDYAEENWPSMDIVAEMIHLHVNRHLSDRFVSTLIIPPYRSRFAKVPMLGDRKGARNADRLLNRYLDYPRMLKRMVRQESFDLFHIIDHSYSQLVHALPAARTVVSCHDLDTFRCLLEPQADPRPAWFRCFTRRTLEGLSRAGAVVCSSEATQSQIHRNRLVDESRLSTAHLGTHPECNAPATPEIVAGVDALLANAGEDNTIDVLHVGSNIARKRIDVLLQVFAGLRTIWPQARLIKVGGAFTPEQSDLARRLGVEPAIKILPFIEDRGVLAEVYRRATVLLLPSEAEGFGMPLAEAIACGTSIVASDIPVLREVAGDRADYCPVGDVPNWVATTSAAIRGILEDPRERDATKKKHKAMYSWESYVSVLAKVYDSLLADRIAAKNFMAKMTR